MITTARIWLSAVLLEGHLRWCRPGWVPIVTVLTLGCWIAAVVSALAAVHGY